VTSMTETEATKKKSAGRNLPVAITVGLLLGAAVLASLFIRREAFIVFTIIACALALYEIRVALKKRNIFTPMVPLHVGSIGILVSAYSAGGEALLVSTALTAGGILVWRVLDGGGLTAVRDAAGGMFAVAYIPFMAGFVMLMLAEPNGPFRVFTFIALAVANDVGGYIMGSQFGRHPLAPSVSPKKSWEGLVGSLVFASIVGALLGYSLFHGQWKFGLVLAGASVVAATLGDLSESLIKRDLRIKDMSSLIPGHGGVLDRLDSLLFTAPAAFLVMELMLPVAT